MNKKHLALALLATLSLSITSCKSKNDAPVVKPSNPVNPTPNPGTPPTGALQVDVNAAVTSDAPVLLKSTAGATIAINGSPYTVGSSGYIGLKEVPSELTVSSDDIEEILIDKAPMPWVKTASFISATVGSRKNLKVNLSSLTGVETFTLSGYKVPELDLTPLKELKILTLGDDKKISAVKKVKLATDNKITRLTSSSPFSNEDLDLSKLKALQYAVFYSPRFTSVSFPNSPLLETLAIIRPAAKQEFELVLTSNPNLKDITLAGVHISNLNIEGVNRADLFKDSKPVLHVKTLRLVGLNKGAVTALINMLNKSTLTSATLPGYRFSVGQAPLVGFTNLTTTNL